MFYLNFIVMGTLLFLESFGQTIITTKSGKIIGKRIRQFDTEIDAFLGIPYAVPPVGNLRFSAPKDIPNWKNQKSATKFGPSCMQSPPLIYSDWHQKRQDDMSEDCLYLNIWVPANIRKNKPLSTMVWIHGSGFHTGSSGVDTYDGAVMASIGKVIMASFNYRLGAFGFLYLKGTEAIGNVGMLDQVKALTWIKHNIEVFGGDANEITLFGHTSGAWSVSLHLVSPLSKGLFKRAIIQSGSGYHPELTVNPEKNLNRSLQFLELYQCPKTDSLDCLRQAFAIQISASDSMLSFYDQSHFGFLPSTSMPFLRDNPINYFDKCEIHDVDVMLGYVQDEGATFMPDSLKMKNHPVISKNESVDILKKMFQINDSSIKPILREYIGNVHDDNVPPILTSTFKAMGDWLIKCPTDFLADILNNGKRKVFHYVFKHKRMINSPKPWMGVPLFEELFFVFSRPFIDRSNYTNEERNFSKNIIQLWSSFAKTGYPISKQLGSAWKPFTKTECRSISFEIENIKLRKLYTEPECKFWKTYYPY